MGIHVEGDNLWNSRVYGPDFLRNTLSKLIFRLWLLLVWRMPSLYLEIMECKGILTE